MHRISAVRKLERDEFFHGAVAGLAGTGAMSVAMAIAKAVGLVAGEPPPRTVSRNAEEATSVYDHLPQPAFEASWVGQHFAYGTAAGMVYALARKQWKLADPVPAGPLFGVASGPSAMLVGCRPPASIRRHPPSQCAGSPR